MKQNKVTYIEPTMEIKIVFEEDVYTSGIVGASNGGEVSQTPGSTYDDLFNTGHSF